VSNIVMSADDVRRAVTRIAHEILERQRGGSQLVLVGLQRGGAWLADAIGAAIDAIEPAARVPVGYIDVSMHRDDIGLRPVVPGAISLQLAVMVDRGHRELPIRPDFVGKNLPTRRDEVVDVNAEGVDLGEMTR